MPIIPSPERHPWLDPWLVPAGERLRDLTAWYAAALQHREQQAGTRQRKRRHQAEADREVTLGVIISNLAYATLSHSPSSRLAVLTGNNGRRIPRYCSPAKGKVLRELLGELSELGALDWQGPQVRRGEASSIAPTNLFRGQLTAEGVSHKDIGRSEQEELVVLTCKQTGMGGQPHGPRVLVDYEETSFTAETRSTMRKLNTFLTSADIVFTQEEGEPVDVSVRRMRRCFVTIDGTPRFDLSGRLYGGFWQNLARDRRHRIRVEGETPMVLDYASMFTRLAYAQMALTPPEGDLYTLPSLAVPRDAVKVLMNTLFFDQHTRKRWPMEADIPEPQGISVPQLREAILRRHPGLKECFGKGLGFQLMHTESQILVAVLDELRSRKIVGLGLHDGLLVPGSQAEVAKKVMEEVGADMARAHIPVHSKSA